MGVGLHELQVDDMRAGSVIVDFTCTSPNAGSALAAVAALGDGGLCFDALSKAVGVTVKPKGGLGITGIRSNNTTADVAEYDDDDDDETDTDVDGDVEEDEDNAGGGEVLKGPLEPSAAPNVQGRSRTAPKVGEIIVVEHGPSAGRLAKVTKVRADGKFEAKVLKRYARSASLPIKGDDGESRVAQTARVAVESNDELEQTIAAVKLARHTPQAPPSWREGMVDKEQPKDTAGRECPVQ